MYPILFGKLDPSKAAQCNHDTASSGAVVGRSDPSTLDGRTPERATGVVQALSDFGAPLSAIAPYTTKRTFLEALSGRDPLRVMRHARDAVPPAYDWWPR